MARKIHIHGLVYVCQLRYVCYRRTQLETFCNGVGSMEKIAPSRVPHAHNFDDSAAQRINKQNSVGNYLHRRWINSIFCIIWRRTLSSDVFERRKSTGSGPFALFSRDFEQILRANTFTCSNSNKQAALVPRHIRREKGSLLPIDSECEDCEWDSDYCNHDPRPLASLDMCRRCSAQSVITGVRLLLF